MPCWSFFSDGKKKKKEGKISNILGDDDDSLCEEI
jgi:hypothetical protein